jgi:hypothetical protein
LLVDLRDRPIAVETSRDPTGDYQRYQLDRSSSTSFQCVCSSRGSYYETARGIQLSRPTANNSQQQQPELRLAVNKLSTRVTAPQEWHNNNYNKGLRQELKEGVVEKSDCSAHRSGTTRVTTTRVLVSTGHYHIFYCRGSRLPQPEEGIPPADSHSHSHRKKNPAARTSLIIEVRTKKRSSVLFHSKNHQSDRECKHRKSDCKSYSYLLRTGTLNRQYIQANYTVSEPIDRLSTPTTAEVRRRTPIKDKPAID